MRPHMSALCLALLLATAQISSAQLRLPNPFRRRRPGTPSPPPKVAPLAPQPQAAAAPAPLQPPTPEPAPAAGASSSTKAAGKCSGNWGLTAIGASGSGTPLPASTDRILICLISSGVNKDAPSINHNRWSGCTKEDPLDPAGCTLPWSTDPSSSGFKPRGTWAATIMAASGSGVIPGATDIHVVPVDGPGTGAVDPSSATPSGRSRLRAYSVCEGRLRGLQAMDYGSDAKSPWRMVMLVDVAADKAASNGPGDFTLSEADWVKVATGSGTPEAPHAPDVLIVAPTGHSASVAFPAALPGVLGVGGYRCNGEPLQSYSGSSGKPDILAPGSNVAVPGLDRLWTDSTAAAALVAGAAARLWSAYPRCNADDIKEALLTSIDGKGQPARLSVQAAATALELNSCFAQPVTR